MSELKIFKIIINIINYLIINDREKKKTNTQKLKIKDKGNKYIKQLVKEIVASHT